MQNKSCKTYHDLGQQQSKENPNLYMPSLKKEQKLDDYPTNKMATKVLMPQVPLRHTQQVPALMSKVYNDDPMLNKVFDGEFKTRRKIDQGAFGKLYEVQSLKSGRVMAVKLEMTTAQYPQILSECKMYQTLRSSGPTCAGIPWVFSCGSQEGYNFLVMELMGDSLESLLAKSPARKFSAKTVAMIAVQMIELIQVFHDSNLIHRDIKPENFCMGRGEVAKQLHILDLGLAKFYRQNNGKHIAYKEGKPLTGTAKYVSLFTHKGIEQSRRDDIQGIGYVVMYLLRGNLPWQNYRIINKKDKYAHMQQMKSEVSLKELCNGYPLEFVQIIKHARQLHFQARPNYQGLKQKLLNLAKRRHWDWDFIYDWTQPDVSNALNKEGCLKHDAK